MRGHKVVTVERQDGYAARCETCGDITFGGFRTRTDARAALAHEKAPGVEPGAVTEEPTKGTISMNDTPTTPDEATVRHHQVDVGNLRVYLESGVDDEPALRVMDGSQEILVGSIDSARALAAALTGLAGPVEFPPRAVNARTYEFADQPLSAHIADLDWDSATTIEEFHALRDEARRRAAAINCGIPGCNKSGHAAMEDPAEWLHWLEETRAGRLEAGVFVGSENYARLEGGPQKVQLTVRLDITDELDDENAVRALAAEIRSYATIVERQVTALELHSTVLKRSQS